MKRRQRACRLLASALVFLGIGLLPSVAAAFCTANQIVGKTWRHGNAYWVFHKSDNRSGYIVCSGSCDGYWVEMPFSERTDLGRPLRWRLLSGVTFHVVWSKGGEDETTCILKDRNTMELGNIILKSQ